jgi:dTDP-4-dehydrorhamnose reductase
MKILLLGHKGYLGRYLNKHLVCNVLNGRGVCNNGVDYDYVINCIGKPNLEYCEDNIEESYYSNCGIVSDILKHYPKSKIINFSSYYVYDDEGFCTEESQVTNEYHYCSQKLESESLVTNGVTFRVGKLFGDEDLSQNKLTEYIIQNHTLTLDNVLFNPTSLKQVLDIVNHELTTNSLNGVYNLSNSGYVSHYEYGCFISKILGKEKTLHRIERHNRVFHNYGKFLMDTSKLNSMVGLTPWEDDITDYLKNL